MDKRFKWTLIGLFTFAFIIVFLPFYTEVLLAAIFAFALDPLTRRIANSKILTKSSIYFRRKQWVAITLAALVIAITLPIAIAVYNIYDTFQTIAEDGLQNSQFYKDLLHLRQVVTEYANDMISNFNLSRRLNLAEMGDQFINNVGQTILAYTTAFLSQLPQFIIHVFIFCCALYYFLAENRQIKTFLMQSRLVQPAELDRLITIFQKSSSATLFASLVTGCIQAAIVAFGGLIFQTGDFFVIFVVTFFLSFIPVIGAAPVALFLALLSLLKLSYGVAIGFVVIAAVAGTIDNLIRPMLVGSGEDVHPVLVLIAIIGSIVIFGLAGLFIGPVIAATTLKLYAVYVLDEDPKSIAPQP